MDTGQCVHCGLCLSSCPTYVETGIEGESPRGRIFLLERLREDPSVINTITTQYLDDCLDCRACEAVCPAHVPTGHLVEAWRLETIQHADDGGLPAFAAFRRLSPVLAFFLGSPKGLLWLQRLSRWSQWPFIGSWVTRLRFVPEPAQSLARGLPRKIPKRLSRYGTVHSMPNALTRAMLFVGCIMDSIYADTNRHTQELLELAGVDVVLPSEQRCCGALHMHGGEPAVTRAWAQDNIQAFEASGASVVVVNAAGCGTMLKEYALLFEAADPWRKRAEKFQAAVTDATVFLAQSGLPSVPPTGVSITVHDPCHLAHAQGIRQEPRTLLEQAGYQVTEMAEADHCCGSAGIYNLTHPDMARSLLKRKIGNIPHTVDWVAAANPGCLMQIQSGLCEDRDGPQAMHPVDLVWDAYQSAGIFPRRESLQRRPQ